MGKILKTAGKGLVKTLKAAAYAAGAPAIVPYLATKWAVNTTKDVTTATAKGTMQAAKFTWDHKKDIVHTGEIIASPVVKTGKAIIGHYEKRKEEEATMLQNQYDTHFHATFHNLDFIHENLGEFVEYFNKNIDPAISLKVGADYRKFQKDISNIKEEFSLENQRHTQRKVEMLMKSLLQWEQQLVMFLESQQTDTEAV